MSVRGFSADMSVRGCRRGRSRTNQMMTRVQNDEPGVCQYEVSVCKSEVGVWQVRGDMRQSEEGSSSPIHQWERDTCPL